MIDPHTPIANASTHDLFNELHRRLLSQPRVGYLMIANKVDEVHHDFAELQLILPDDQRV